MGRGELLRGKKGDVRVKKRKDITRMKKERERMGGEEEREERDAKGRENEYERERGGSGLAFALWLLRFFFSALALPFLWDDSRARYWHSSPRLLLRYYLKGTPFNL